MKPEKISRSDYGFVERLLYQQKTHDTAIAELQAELDDMLPSCSVSVVPLSHGGTKPLTEPERIADKRLHSVRGKYLQEEIATRLLALLATASSGTVRKCADLLALVQQLTTLRGSLLRHALLVFSLFASTSGGNFKDTALS